MDAHRPADYTGLALAFATALTNRDYQAGYAMTSRDYQRRMPLEAMHAAYEAIVPEEFGPATSLEVGLTLETWPDKQAADVGWVYVCVGGDVYSEGITVVVTTEDGALKVRDVEFGRP